MNKEKKRQKKTPKYREQTGGCQKGSDGGMDKIDKGE